MISCKLLYRAEASKAAAYYAEQKDDYYHSDASAAQWQGHGAQSLGLVGHADPQQVARAMRGDLGSHVQLAKTVRLDSRARAGLDLTFSAPKSVTLQALLFKDHRVIEAHDKAVTEALEHLEKTMAIARQKVNGKSITEDTGNLMIAKYRHETARPTDNGPPDPQLHTHALIMNLTQRSDGIWVTLSNEMIMQKLKLIDAHYMAVLGRELEKHGFELRYEKNHIELAHFTREQIEGFSNRKMAIDAKLAEQGLDRKSATHGQKQTATLATRLQKDKDYTREELEPVWQQRGQDLKIQNVMTTSLDGDEASALSSQGLGRPSASKSQRASRPDFAAIQAMRWALKHHTEREAVVSESKLLTSAISHGKAMCSMQDLRNELRRLQKTGDVLPTVQIYRSQDQRDLLSGSREQLARQLAQDEDISPSEGMKVVDAAIATGHLVPAEPHFTTKVALSRESEMLAIELRGRAAVPQVLTADAAQQQLQGLPLKTGQQLAVEMMVTGSDRFQGIQGLAGSGKSHMLKHSKALLEAAGYKVIAVAPYSSQARNLRELGIPASTIASRLEGSKNRFAKMLDEKTIVIVDEAGVVPGRQMRDLMRIIEANGARAVLLGDTGQTKAIEATPAFQQLQAAGMKTALMSEIVRQSNQKLLAAVQQAAKGKAKEALANIESVHQIEDNEKRYQQIAAHYCDLPLQAREQTLILTGTNASRNAINDETHKAMGLEGKGHHYTLLTRRDSTQAERRYSRYYVAGDVIQPERDYQCGLQKGHLYRVIGGIENNKLRVQSLENNQNIDFLPSRTRKISVYQPIDAELSTGDIVRITRNDKDLDVANGDRAVITQVSPDAISLKIGERELTLPASSPVHLDRAYATTAHSAQGLTSENVIVNLEANSRTTKRDVFYVDISRAKQEAVIFTDNLGNLPQSVQRREEKSIALDVVDRKSHQGPEISAQASL